jgi:hypothetical protein
MLSSATIRRAITASSLKAFGETYFTGIDGTPLRYSTGQIHAIQQLEKVIDAKEDEPHQFGLMIPRGHGKTTSILMIAVLWAQLRKNHPAASWGSDYAVLATAGTLYKQLSRDLRLMITGLGPLVKADDGSALLVTDWGLLPSKHHPKREEVGLWQVEDFAFYVTGTSSISRRRISVRGINSGEMNVRGLVDMGKRPDFGWVDDGMKDMEADNKDITSRVKETVRTAFSAAFQPNARFGVTGTPFNDHDLISEIIHKPESWPGWRRVKLSCFDRVGRPLLPQVWNKDQLMRRKRAIGSRAFASQYLLNPMGGGVRLFEEKWILKWMSEGPSREEVTRVMYCDPSLGRNAKSDLSAIVILDLDSRGISWVRHVSMKRRRPLKLVDDYLDLWMRWAPELHAIEDAGQQEFLIPIFGNRVKERSLHRSAVPLLQSHNHLSKVSRIKALSGEIEFGRIRFCSKGDHLPLRDQAVGYRGKSNEYDDGLDALEGAWRLVQSHILEEWDIDDIKEEALPEFSGVLDMDF